MNGVSVIVCCYNSAKRLPATIEHLALQKVPPEIPWEVIIVNNASTDNTVEVAKREWSKHKIDVSFRIVDQPKAGLSYAREKGIEKSQYEFLIFCDDDNWLNEDYIRITFETMSNYNDVSLLGGCGIAYFEVEKPFWFNEFERDYAVGPQGIEDGYIKSNIISFYGAGMVIRKSSYYYLINNGFKHFVPDRVGNKLISGGDSELCYAFNLSNFSFFYNSKLKFQHFILKQKLQTKYLIELNKSFALTKTLLFPYFLIVNKIGKTSFTLSWPILLLKNFYHLFKIEGLGFYRIFDKNKRLKYKIDLIHRLLQIIYILKFRSYFLNSVKKILSSGYVINDYKDYYKTII